MRALATVLLGPAQQVVFPFHCGPRRQQSKLSSGSKRAVGPLACRRECLQRLLR
jgi:hypothetical protein